MTELAVPDRQYDPSLLEPMLPTRSRKLEDLAIELAAKSGQMTQGLHPIVVQSLGNGDWRGGCRIIDRILPKPINNVEMITMDAAISAWPD